MGVRGALVDKGRSARGAEGRPERRALDLRGVMKGVLSKGHLARGAFKIGLECR
jgi:hypothetical protein